MHQRLPNASKAFFDMPLLFGSGSLDFVIDHDADLHVLEIRCRGRCEARSVARAVWLASDFTSCATTANPSPASPARAASMVALSASKFVCPAMSRIKPRMDSIDCTSSESWRLFSTASAD